MWKKDYKPLVLITIGEVTGVGPEVIAKTLQDERLRNAARIFVIGTDSVFNYFLNKDQINVTDNLKKYLPTHVNIIRVGDIKGVEFGKPTKSSARLAMQSLEVAVELVKQEKNASLVTAPIYKKGMQDAGFSFPGHTEFLSERFNSKVLMSFWGKRLRVATITTHLPLKEVPKNITREKLATALNISFNSLSSLLKKEKPCIAVVGLNPHAGEEGKLGDEEIKVINPLCEEFRKNGYNLNGPLPADTAFGNALKGAYDMVIGMYHDQVLAPFKMLYFEDGVNVTLGLPFVRTSPDHGTAFDIAGKGVASEKSFINAVKLAIKMEKSRRNK